MDLAEAFVSRYFKEFDYYEQLARIAAQIIEKRLSNSGVRAIVTYRAKNPERLKIKINGRISAKGYKNLDQIYEDIVDLSGVRIAIYFPSDRDQVDQLIRESFDLKDDRKSFPEHSKITTSYDKRFSGYWAFHYRVSLRDDETSIYEKRFVGSRIEIQVASLMMHAWSEVEHDLVYKPLQGMLSEDEYAILDELNGLVLAGEIALERLKRAGERRLSESGAVIFNRYDLSALLLNNLHRFDADESHLGRIDLLYTLIDRLEMRRVKDIKPFIELISGDFESRPVADQIIDKIIGSSRENYQIYLDITDGILDSNHKESEAKDALINSWITFESIVVKKFPEITEGSSIKRMPSIPKVLEFLRNESIISFHESVLLTGSREIRNRLIHGKPHSFSSKDFYDSARIVSEVSDRINKRTS